MENQFMLSDLVAELLKLAETHGNLPVYTGNMEPMTEDDLEVIEAEEPEKYGSKFVHIGAW
jgi:hypothetical protein